VTSRLTLSAGGRYAYEKVEAFNTPTFGILPLTPPNPAPLADPRGSFTFKKFTPKAVIRYRPDDNTTLYASYSQGFKSGYVNTNQINACAPSPTCIPAPVKPETVDAFEVGFKGRIANALDVNLAAFHYKYKDIQIFTFTPPAASTFKNAAAGRINGFELFPTASATRRQSRM
jgi:iron complex outermembrane receptor protein